MSDYLIHLTEEEFEQQTLCPKNTLLIEFEHNSFKKGPTFSLSMREQAIKYCQKMMTKNLKSLLIENKQCLTIWIQQKSPNFSTIKSDSEALNQNVNQKKDTTNTVNRLPTKKITRVYRGQTYEVEVPDRSTVRQSSQDRQTLRRKYRGQYID